MIHWANLVLLLFSVLSTSFSEPTAAATFQKSWTLHHSFTSSSSKTFQRRGRIQLTVEGQEVKLELENDPISLKDFTNDGWYQLKLVPDDQEEGPSSDAAAVVTTVPACQLRRANFRDELILMFGESGQVLSLSHVPLVSPLAPKSCDDLEPLSSEPSFLQSKISYETSNPGMSLRVVLTGEKPPPGLKYLPFPKKQQSSTSNPLMNDNKNGGNENNKQQPDSSPFGFLRRYWYIFLPLMVMNLMSAPAQPDPPQEQQQGRQPVGPQSPAIASTAGTGAGPAAAATSPAAGGASSPGGAAAASPQRQRRGKRG